MKKNRVSNIGITILTATSLYAVVPATFANDISYPTASSCSGSESSQFGMCSTGQQDAAEAYANDHQPAQTPGHQQSSNSPSAVSDQRALHTAELSIPDEAKRYWDWAKCASVSIGTAPNDARVSDEDCTLPPELAMAGFTTRDSEAVPTTREILLAAATLIHADGAGLRKRPNGVSYTNKYVPTLVSVTNPRQTHVINLLGHDITITLKATNYEWDWGDGTPNTITAYQGMAFEKGMDPNKDPRLIRHYYTPPNGWRSRFDGPYPNATRTITLTTTWSGTATNPFTGETQTINGLVTTTETTGPFPLNHLIVSNTDTWEEKQGH